MAYLTEMPKMLNSQILGNILYPAKFFLWLYAISHKGTTKHPTPQKSIFQATETCETSYCNCILRFYQNISGGSTRTTRPKAKKPVVVGNKRSTSSLHSIKPTWEFGTRCLEPHLLFKYYPVVLEVKIERPPYPLHRLFPSLCCYSQKNSACWIIHSNQMCGVWS